MRSVLQSRLGAGFDEPGQTRHSDAESKDRARRWNCRFGKYLASARWSRATGAHGGNGLPASQGGRGEGTFSNTWAVGLAAGSVALGAPGLLLGSTQLLEWSAVALVLLAFVGRRARWAGIIAATLAGLGGLYVAADHVQRIWGSAGISHWAYVAGGLLVITVSLVQAIGALRRQRRLDPVVSLSIQLGIGLIARWSYYLNSGIGLDPGRYSPDTWRTPFVAELPLLALGLAGVGVAVFRGWRPTLTRLGVVRPTWWQSAYAVVVAMFVGLLGWPANLLTYLLTPRAYDAINAIEDKTETGLVVALVFAVLAGVSEETLFRGALQPRAGIVLTALLFAAIHVQYGATPILASVFVAGLAYGWLRQRMNTTTAIMAHAGYDIAAFLPGGVGVFGLGLAGLALAVIAIRADGHRWSRYLAPLAAGGSFLVLGAGVVAVTGNPIAWKAFSTAAFLSFAIAVVLEALRLRSIALTFGGLLAWLMAVAIMWSIPWPARVWWLAPLASAIAIAAGVGAWYRLASSGYARV